MYTTALKNNNFTFCTTVIYPDKFDLMSIIIVQYKFSEHLLLFILISLNLTNYVS